MFEGPERDADEFLEAEPDGLGIQHCAPLDVLAALPTGLLGRPGGLRLGHLLAMVAYIHLLSKLLH